MRHNWLRPSAGAWLVLLSAAFSSPARAQLPVPSPAKILQFGLGGGSSTPFTDTGDALKTGWHAQAMLKVSPPALPLWLRGDLAYHHFGLKNDSGSARIYGATARVGYNVLPAGPFKPYVTVGVGTYKVSGLLASGGTSTEDSETTTGVDVGLGASLSLLGFSAFGEARIHNVYTDKGYGDKGSTHFLPLTFGLNF